MKHSLRRDKKAIRFHYDINNEFYRLFLGKHMVYSCAYFKDVQESIDQAQENKLEHICRKLCLKPGDNFLDIGCGWGSLIRYAARHYRVRALGITLSTNQYQYTCEQIEHERLRDCCRVEIMDWRELRQRRYFDKIASIGMCEHIGKKNFPLYLRAIKQLLTTDGLFLNHGITGMSVALKSGTGSPFMNRLIFPDAELMNMGLIYRMMENAGFEMLDMESLREHYAHTLRLWFTGLKQAEQRSLEIVDRRIYRAWLIYLAGCSLGFSTGKTNVYQALLSKCAQTFAPIPLTRAHIYAEKPLKVRSLSESVSDDLVEGQSPLHADLSVGF